MVFGPREYGGIGVRHLYIEQGSQQTATFMRHYRNGGRIGRALRIGLQWFQLINGISYDSFEQLNRPLRHAVGSWFISIRQYLTVSGFGLKFTKPLYTVCKRRTHDRVLMDDALHIVKTPKKIQQINKVRLFLNASQKYAPPMESNSKNPCGPQNHLRSRTQSSIGLDRATPARRHGSCSTSSLNSTQEMRNENFAKN
jgi:hypothetical protein